MTRKLVGIIRDGRFLEVEDGYIVPTTPNQSAAIHGDAMPPLKHPVTGKIYDSMRNYLRDTKRLGLEIVGNDLLSKKKNQFKETLTEKVILDKIEKAESIMEDPSKLRARMNENMERYERIRKIFNGN